VNQPKHYGLYDRCIPFNSHVLRIKRNEQRILLQGKVMIGTVTHNVYSMSWKMVLMNRGNSTNLSDGTLVGGQFGTITVDLTMV